MADADFRKAVLDNGLTLVVERHPYVRTASLGLWVKVGSGTEKLAVNGISHFIEHMVFKGTESRNPLQIATVLECLGGDLNAFTDRETTCYHATVLQEHVEVAIDVLSDLALRPTFPKDQLERERQVLLQELSMIEEAPDDWINDVFFSTVWKGHPLGLTVIGNRKTILGITRAQLVKHFKGHYRPENMVLAVAGNVELEKVRELAEKYFRFPEGVAAKVPRSKPVPFKGGRKHVPFDSDQTHLLIGFEGIGFQSPYRFDALILSFFLGGGMSSRLFQEIREKAGLAYSVDCDCVPFRDTGIFSIYAAMAPRSVPKCLAIVKREIQRLRETPLSDEDLNLVKGQLKGTILLNADQMEVRQESLGRNEVIFGRYVSVDEVVQEIDRVSAKRIHELAQRLFVPEKEMIVTVGRLPSKKPLPSVVGS